MRNEEQLKVVSKAYELTSKIRQLNEENDGLNRYLGNVPKQRDVGKKEEYPRIRTKHNFFKCFLQFIGIGLIYCVLGNCLIALISNLTFNTSLQTLGNIFSFIVYMIGFLWLPTFIVYYMKVYKLKINKEIESIRNSEAYIEECNRIDAEYNSKVLNAESEYNAKLVEYENSKPNILHEIELNKKLIVSKSSDLVKLYGDTKVIPKQYQYEYALRYLYELMSTSDYDIKEAINLFEQNETRLREEHSMRLHAQSNEIERQKAYAMEEQNRISEKIARDNRLNNAANVIQNHNRNKYLKTIANR